MMNIKKFTLALGMFGTLNLAITYETSYGKEQTKTVSLNITTQANVLPWYDEWKGRL